MIKLFFKENQKFDQKWLWAILSLSAIIPVSILMNNESFKLDATNFIVISMMLLPMILIYFTELRVEISDEGLKYQFYPFHLRVYEIKSEEIEKYNELIYSPLKDYGGWGIRYGFSGTAYNVSGNKGVEIFLKNGTKILFGTKKPYEFFEALNKATQQ